MASDHQRNHFVDSTGTRLDRAPDAVRTATDGFVLNSQGHVLLQLRADNGYWGLPGGNVDVGESVEQGVIREVFEETGLHTRVTRLIGIYSDPDLYSIMRYPDGTLIQYVTLVFACEYQSGELAVSDESADIGYFAPDELPENTLLSHRIRIEDALSGSAEPFIK